MDFYTGKPERPIEHYGIIHYSFQTKHGKGFINAMGAALSGSSSLIEQSDDEALDSIAQLILEKHSNANVIYDMRISSDYVPVFYGIVTKIYASYGRFID